MIGRAVLAAVHVIAEQIPNDRSAIDATKAPPAIVRAVIAAMREPTEAMIQAAYAIDMSGTTNGGTDNPFPDDVWRVMIDEALKDG